MIADAILSLLFALGTFMTLWLLIPALLFLPLSFVFAYRFYKKMVARFSGAPVLARVVGLLPMAISLATLPAAGAFYKATYQA